MAVIKHFSIYGIGASFLLLILCNSAEGIESPDPDSTNATEYGKGCRWDGTSPLCDGSCTGNEIKIKEHFRGDGISCYSGKKFLCCPDPKLADRRGCDWIGTAPFCQGRCPEHSTQEKVDKYGDGVKCWTGIKRYCCRYYRSGTYPLG